MKRVNISVYLEDYQDVEQIAEDNGMLAVKPVDDNLSRIQPNNPLIN